MGNGKVIDGKGHPVNHSGSQTQRREPIRKEKMNRLARYYMPISAVQKRQTQELGTNSQRNRRRNKREGLD